MKYLTIISLAGLLTAWAPNAGMAQQGTTVRQCNDPVCTVWIDVVGTGDSARIKPDPDRLEVTREPVTIHFRVIAEYYVFVTPRGKAVEFKDEGRAATQFTRDNSRGGPKRIVMTDRNVKVSNDEYPYTIRLRHKDTGVEIALDPIIINK